ncbi:hypothetical protein [Micromonospora sp. LH3U1]|uniref:hypothetical protein n=1 Tax=Micromonospora sp. LH3U1 TaxID=3018339 RepID=UPI00234B2A1A|nr:hypothetical protein [Micromonospora sp. LH3U1]WCN83176.1 hypothetical protein PCA76_09035 [Micromonospora sp. LH3U1]
MTQPQRGTPLATPTSTMVAAMSSWSVSQVPAPGGCPDRRTPGAVAVPHPPAPLAASVNHAGWCRRAPGPARLGE